MSARPLTYKRLTIKKKLEILNVADEIKNDREVGRRYKVDPATIRGWRKQREKLALVCSSEKGGKQKNKLGARTLGARSKGSKNVTYIQ